MTTYAPTDRTTIRRTDRGVYDRDVVHAILDEALFCHVGFVVDRRPLVIPTIHTRIDDVLYLHGAPATRMLRAFKKGAPVCVTVTQLDGIVFARSAFHHSMNYRSVVVFGTARAVTDAAEKLAALDALVEHVAAGRSGESRPPNDKELRGTAVIAVTIAEASAKVRTGPAVEEPEDLETAAWGGVLPLSLVSGVPEPDPDVAPDSPVPPSIANWHRPSTS